MAALITTAMLALWPDVRNRRELPGANILRCLYARVRKPR
jgi:hypothetical protein